MDTEFKVGDEVRVLCKTLKKSINSIGVIIRIDSLNYVYPYKVEFTTPKGKIIENYSLKELKLVKAKEPEKEFCAALDDPMAWEKKRLELTDRSLKNFFD